MDKDEKNDGVSSNSNKGMMSTKGDLLVAENTSIRQALLFTKNLQSIFHGLHQFRETELKSKTERLADRQEDKNSDASNSLSKNLATRKDVVNKTLARSVKRYYTEQFAEGYNYIGSLKCEKAIKCMQMIDKVNFISLNISKILFQH